MKKARVKVSFFNYFFILYFLILFLGNNSLFHDHQQYSLLAHSFLKGKLYFLEKFGNVYDAALYQNRLYWPLGPLPAILLIPIILIFGFENAPQGLVSFFLILFTYFILKKIVLLFDYQKKQINWLIFFWFLATPYFGVSFIPVSWYFAHVATSFFIFLSFLVFLKYQKIFLTGLLVGLAVLCRLTTAPVILFFVSYLYFRKEKELAKKILLLCFPFIFSLVILASYNWLRFDHILETGYNYQLINGIIPEDRKSWGQINWHYFPDNLYRLFLKGIIPRAQNKSLLKLFKLSYNPKLYEGLGLLLTTPAIFYILKANCKKVLVKSVWFSSTLIIFCQLISCGSGGFQLGNRLSLDFLPLWFLLFLSLGLKNISNKLKLLFIGQALLNLYLIYNPLIYYLCLSFAGLCV